MDQDIQNKPYFFSAFAKNIFFLSAVTIYVFISFNISLVLSQTVTQEIVPEIEDKDFGDDFEDEFSTADEELFDPLSGYNRIMTGINDMFFTNVLLPVAKGYSRVIPEGIRRGTFRFFKNLIFPVRFANNVLQIKFKNAGEETLRFTLNSTVGILGFWDPAGKWFKLQAHDEDFGQTLGHYGVGGGFHLVLPFLGPSNLRDTLSLLPDYYLQPVGQFKPIGLLDSNIHELAAESFDIINENSLHIGEYESFKKDAVELYPFIREVYEQRRAKQIEE